MSDDKKPEINEHLFWMDLETTGLDAEGRDVILEVAVVVTDRILHQVNMFGPRVIHHPSLPEMDPVVVKMHTESRLLQDVERSPDTSLSVERQLVEFLAKYEGQLVLCGSTIHFDRRFVRRFWKQVEARLHYRMIDVSSVKLLGRTFFGAEKPKNGPAAHRAGPDVMESISELRYWRDEMFHDPKDTATTGEEAIRSNLRAQLRNVNVTTDWQDYLHLMQAYEIARGMR